MMCTHYALRRNPINAKALVGRVRGRSWQAQNDVTCCGVEGLVTAERGEGDRSLQCQRILWVGSKTRGLGPAQLFLDRIRPQYHRDYLVRGMAPAHSFAAHAA